MAAGKKNGSTRQRGRALRAVQGTARERGAVSPSASALAISDGQADDSPESDSIPARGPRPKTPMHACSGVRGQASETDCSRV